MLLIDEVPYPRVYTGYNGDSRYVVSHPGGHPLYVHSRNGDGTAQAVAASSMYSFEGQLLRSGFELKLQSAAERDRVHAICHQWRLISAIY